MRAVIVIACVLLSGLHLSYWLHHTGVSPGGQHLEAKQNSTIKPIKQTTQQAQQTPASQKPTAYERSPSSSKFSALLDTLELVPPATIADVRAFLGRITTTGPPNWRELEQLIGPAQTRQVQMLTRLDTAQPIFNDLLAISKGHQVQYSPEQQSVLLQSYGQHIQTGPEIIASHPDPKSYFNALRLQYTHVENVLHEMLSPPQREVLNWYHDTLVRQKQLKYQAASDYHSLVDGGKL